MARSIRNSSPFAMLTVAGALAASLLGAPSAQATIIFTPGNHPQQPGEVNILFGAPETGLTINGEVGHTGIGVQFTSLTGETLRQTAQGQAFIENDAGGFLTSMGITVPGHTFEDFIFNLQGLNGQASIDVRDNLGNISFFDLVAGPGNGSNFLTITTAAGELIDAVFVNAEDGFDSFKQPRISGVSGVSIPEPSGLALLGSAIIGFGLLRRRKASAARSNR